MRTASHSNDLDSQNLLIKQPHIPGNTRKRDDNINMLKEQDVLWDYGNGERRYRNLRFPDGVADDVRTGKIGTAASRPIQHQQRRRWEPSAKPEQFSSCIVWHQQTREFIAIVASTSSSYRLRSTREEQGNNINSNNSKDTNTKTEKR